MFFYLYLYFTIADKDLQSSEGTVFRTYERMNLKVNPWVDGGVDPLEGRLRRFEFERRIQLYGRTVVIDRT